MLRFNNFNKVGLTEELVKLTPAQLIKPNGKTGEARIDILKRLIQSGEPLELAKGGRVVVVAKRNGRDPIASSNE